MSGSSIPAISLSTSLSSATLSSTESSERAHLLSTKGASIGAVSAVYRSGDMILPSGCFSGIAGLLVCGGRKCKPSTSRLLGTLGSNILLVGKGCGSGSWECCKIDPSSVVNQLLLGIVWCHVLHIACSTVRKMSWKSLEGLFTCCTTNSDTTTARSSIEEQES